MKPGKAVAKVREKNTAWRLFLTHPRYTGLDCTARAAIDSL